jgi:hypothetical protein
MMLLLSMEEALLESEVLAECEDRTYATVQQG